jgi:hypothetical protein
MKVVMTLVVRDEEDILDAQIAFHLNAGVDLVVAIDNASRDGSTEILEAYARSGHLHLIRDDGDMHQGRWVTGLARLAATDFGADWIINSDVDGFWWPRGGTLKEVFAAVPPRFGGVRAMVRNFAPRPEGEPFFAERMTVRVCNPGDSSNSPYSPRFQTAHRGDPEVVVSEGAHHAYGDGLTPLRGWYPIDMLHFPVRSVWQAERKLLRWRELLILAGQEADSFRAGAYDASQAGRMEEFYDSYLVDDDELARGLADGTLALDTRVRDALRALRREEPEGPPQFELPPEAPALGFEDAVVDEAYLSELGRLTHGDPVVAAQRRADLLEQRLASAERSVWSRVKTLASPR